MKRYNYFEDLDVLSQLESLAAQQSTTVSALIRSATKALVDDAAQKAYAPDA